METTLVLLFCVDEYKKRVILSTVLACPYLDVSPSARYRLDIQNSTLTMWAMIAQSV